MQRLCAQRATSRRHCFPAASGWATATAASTRLSTPARVANSSGPSPRSCAVAGAGRRRRRRAPGQPPEDISTNRTSRHRLISARPAGTRRWRTSRRQPSPPPPTWWLAGRKPRCPRQQQEPSINALAVYLIVSSAAALVVPVWPNYKQGPSSSD